MATLTKAEAAKLVKRTIIETKDSKAVTKEVVVTEAEVLSFTEYTETVVVVTTDGQKLVGQIK